MLTHAWDCWIIQNSGCINHLFWWFEIIGPRNHTFWPDMPLKTPRKHLFHTEICKASSCPRSLYWLQIWSLSEVNGNFATGFCQQNTAQREENSLEKSYSDAVCPPSGHWSIGGSFFRAQMVSWELQEWNPVLFWVCRSVLSLSNTH